jgi:hypothetical protein
MLLFVWLSAQPGKFWIHPRMLALDTLDTFILNPLWLLYTCCSAFIYKLHALYSVYCERVIGVRIVLKQSCIRTIRLHKVAVGLVHVSVFLYSVKLRLEVEFLLRCCTGHICVEDGSGFMYLLSLSSACLPSFVLLSGVHKYCVGAVDLHECHPLLSS